ncbi:MAG: redoxin domain-containing protein [Streptosporangiaceae bacterium]
MKFISKTLGGDDADRAWCPFCPAQLRAFERASATLARTGIRVVGLSVDDEETAAEMGAKNKLTFPSATARTRPPSPP